MSENILSVQNLHTSFHTDKGEVKAVNGVTFNLEKGKILGIVGESGSGKSVTAYSIMRILEKNGRITEGKILYKGQDIAEFSEKQMREFRGKCCSIIFQDPMTSLNPVFTVGNQLKEAIELHTDRKGKEAETRAIEMLTLVGVNEPEKRVKQYPYELSGANAKAKANAAQAIGELIRTATNKSMSEDHENKHGTRAQNGWYRYDVRFGIPVYDQNEDLERYNIYTVKMLVRHDADGKLYLYDIIRTKKETSTPSGLL